MKAILISIKPKYVAQILNKQKTIVIRKSYPKCDLPIDVYIYCCYGETLSKGTRENILTPDGKIIINKPPKLNGSVVAKFTLNKVEPIVKSYHNYWGGLYYSQDLTEINLLDKAQISREEIGKYLENSKGYAWHIDNLEIFDKPKELSEFKHPKPSICGVKDNKGLYQCDKCKYGHSEFWHCECRLPLTKAPESWCYVEVLL